MRISRKKRPEKALIPRYKKNAEIEAEQLLVLDEDGKSLGAMSRRVALDMALEKELDLVEINPKSEPPVVKLIDFTEFKYQKEKEARKQKAHSRASEIKGIRLSVRISNHDLDIKREQAIKFLNRGDKVKIELQLKGRENARPEIANETITEFVKKVQEHVEIKVEQETSRQGKKVTAVIAKK
ncbi:MAG: translation initiation factor IF-3 [Candidatus Magasanikbacteria bacterium]|nr:translation initiation factor IF-3 [Candidatus Magasanikbacteria bacterium]